MKPAVIYAIAAIALSSCAAPAFVSPCDVPAMDFREAWMTASSVNYAPSREWRRPETTYATMEGDCEDIAGLFIALAGEGEVIVVNGLHAVVFFPGQGYCEPQCYGMRYTMPEGARIERYNLNEYLAMCGK